MKRRFPLPLRERDRVRGRTVAIRDGKALAPTLSRRAEEGEAERITVFMIPDPTTVAHGRTPGSHQPKAAVSPLRRNDRRTASASSVGCYTPAHPTRAEAGQVPRETKRLRWVL